MRIRTIQGLAVGLAFAGLGGAGTAGATPPGPDGFVQTGLVVRMDRAGVPYSILHEVKELPKQRTSDALVTAEVDKRFVITPLRDATCADFRAMLDVRLTRNGARRQLEGALPLACSATLLRAHSRILLNYSARTKIVTLRIERQGTAEASGTDAMRVVWNAWLGPAEQVADRKALSSHM